MNKFALLAAVAGIAFAGASFAKEETAAAPANETAVKADVAVKAEKADKKQHSKKEEKASKSEAKKAEVKASTEAKVEAPAPQDAAPAAGGEAPAKQ